ncbi:MAG TPA: 2-C-methyl-D-erythritol 2,4-cyclodiphosphate synthase [Candidatus Omnitrophica bacterium]|nr:2-C-methyl-D-erythritol 2,4-cyclodiphosphate synthase [Candidatus Omnitrophota bacterium]
MKKSFLKVKLEKESFDNLNQKNSLVGLGFDVHRFTKRRKKLVLGGWEIDYPWGLEAVSDGDVVLHAICDAILGGAGLGDIGDYFPPNKKKLQGMSSKNIVNLVLKKIKGKLEIVNIDVTVILDRLRLFPYKRKIVTSLRKIFKIERINFKIKSREKLELLGGKDAIACLAVVLLKQVC